ncbi:MAG: extracellular solute-binding protein [Burkholderiales bacterium]|nr:extracellular solute-binding protein [Burkholderiales bacterium]MDE2397888.1 extracellular solute-binding protein [Burkholderiales bacterium]MDE2456788.1 extracellular solute-binding protein [Burkholderiales bacterium]
MTSARRPDSPARGLATLLATLALVFWAAPMTAQGQERPRFELMHSWLGQSEQPGLDVLRDAMVARGVDWSEDRTQSSVFGLFQKYAARAAAGNPPTAMYWLPGKEIRRLVDLGAMRKLPLVVNGRSFDEWMLPEVLDGLRWHGGLPVMPLGIFLHSYTVYNAAVFKKLNLPYPKDWEEFLAQMPTIQAAGITPVSMSDEYWQIGFVFLAIFDSRLSAEEFSQFIGGEGPLARWVPRMTWAFDVMRRMQPFTNRNSRDLPWEEVVKPVLQGQAAVSFPINIASSLVGNSPDVVCDLPLGNHFVHGIVQSLAFPVVKSAAEKAGQDIALEVLSDPRVMDEFIRRKGGISVWKDASVSGQSRCARRSAQLWKEWPHVLDVNPEWPNRANALIGVVQSFWRDPTMTPAAAAEKVLAVHRLLREK